MKISNFMIGNKIHSNQKRKKKMIYKIIVEIMKIHKCN